MRSTQLFAIVLLPLFALSLPAQLPQLPKLSLPGNAAGLSDGKIASGLKEALAVGTDKAIKQVDHPGGYLDDAAIKILLPSSLHPAESVLRAAGQGPKIDDFVASMNHAAESAAPEAAPIFSDAVKQMTIDDARKLLAGGDTSITDYFRAHTSAQLTTAFRPHVEAAMNQNGVTQQYQALAARAPSVPFMNSGASHFDITTYVVGKALDGLFYELGQQEKAIRTNPAARSTALLKEVFGR